jgi:small subunit ribosomal protein S7
MPRRGTITRREVLPDPVYNSKLVTQVINKVLLDGKKSTSEQIVYGALEIVREKTGRDPVEVLQEAVEVPGRRARTLAIRWLVSFARARREKVMTERLANEMLDSLQGQGGAFKKKDDIFRMAQANKAFAHYRW